MVTPSWTREVLGYTSGVFRHGIPCDDQLTSRRIYSYGVFYLYNQLLINTTFLSVALA